MHDLSVYTDAGLFGEQPVVWVVLLDLRVVHRGLPVGIAGHDRADDVFHIPCVRALGLPGRLHEFGRQPVQQLRMARPLALRTEIAEHLGKACTEELLPQPIHKDSGCKRVFA